MVACGGRGVTGQCVFYPIMCIHTSSKGPIDHTQQHGPCTICVVGGDIMGGGEYTSQHGRKYATATYEHRNNTPIHTTAE